jgi:transcriptional regulator with XRE-family HTH domain
MGRRKQELLSMTDFSKLCGVSRQAVSKAVKNGLLDVVLSGKLKKIDKNVYKSVRYLKSFAKERKSETRKIRDKIIKNNSISPKKINKKGKKKVKDDIIEEKEKTVSITLPKNNGNQKEIAELIKLANRLEYAKTEKMEQQAISEKLKNARLRGELIDREMVYNNVFLYLDKLHSNLERLADSFLSDLGGRIIDKGKVTPKFRSIWKNEIMSQIDETKKTIVKQIKSIAKSQK